MRRQLRTPPRSRYVQGPASVLDRFVAYADQLKADLAFRSLDRARAVDIMQRIFSSASRRETLGKHSKGGRRGGGLKIDWTKPLPRA
jgi:hypothetical protein